VRVALAGTADGGGKSRFSGDLTAVDDGAPAAGTTVNGGAPVAGQNTGLSLWAFYFLHNFIKNLFFYN
jgi:hypothetical protein